MNEDTLDGVVKAIENGKFVNHEDFMTEEELYWLRNGDPNLSDEDLFE